MPFPFEANGVAYPEGEYEVQLYATKLVKLTNITTLRSAVVNAPIVSGSKPPEKPELIFTRSGNTGMRLSEIWLQGYPGLVTVSKAKEASARVAVAIN